MEPRQTPPEHYSLDIFADASSVRDVLKGRPISFTVLSASSIDKSIGVLNLIFFHRFFPSIRPISFDVLDLTLPAINDVNLDTLIDSRISALVRQHLSSPISSPGGIYDNGGGSGVRGRMAVEFYEKRRRRSSGTWFSGLAGKGEEEVCWEVWTLDITIATPRTESGMRAYVHSDHATGIKWMLMIYREGKSPQGYGEYAPESSTQDPRRR